MSEEKIIVSISKDILKFIFGLFYVLSIAVVLASMAGIQRNHQIYAPLFLLSMFDIIKRYESI